MTAFKRTARLRQAQWRESNSHPIGRQRILPKNSEPQYRPSGTRIPLDYAVSTGANFLSPAIRSAVDQRLGSPEPYQTLDVVRLRCDLLSSMPMCFNLFGELSGDPERAGNSAVACWPDLPCEVEDVRFEWSPGRLDRTYLNNRSALDAAVLTRLSDGRRGVLGIETKYHEHAVREKPPKEHADPARDRLGRYRQVAAQSGVFAPGALDRIVSTDLQQIWLDHLLVLSMLQHPSGGWRWGRFILIAPERNTSFADAAHRYRSLLANDSTFEYRTIEGLLDAGPLPAATELLFRERYLW